MIFAKHTFHCLAFCGILRHEQHADAVLALVRQLETGFVRRPLQKFMRHLHQDACAVAGIGLATASAAVIEVHEDLQRLLYERMGFASLDVD